MSLQTVISLTAGLIGTILFINAFELLFIVHNPLFYKVWTFENLKDELTSHLPLPKRLTTFIFCDTNFKYLPILQLCLIILMLYHISLWAIVTLLIIHLLTCIRFRGTFNGGSDMMIVIVLTGLVISLIHTEFQRAGMVYIAVHTVFSYFRAGMIKLKSQDWKSGRAIKSFLNRSPFGIIKKLAEQLQDRPRLNLILCWSVIIFELAAGILVLVPQFKIPYFICALIFHLLICFGFGLNRFFWAWLAAWPSVYFTLSLF